ncbi:MAG TPA: ATP-dependent RNA helicase HrpA [Gammaproteobacteria bacterium]|nr:ATP-dependent RNA helicase HrpA [Gammaproteobacteria bacterium]
MDDCRARDIPALRKRQQEVRRRMRRGRPVSRDLAALEGAVEASLARVEARRSSLPELRYPAALPVVAKRAVILEALARSQVVVLCGATGSGKTTQLPKICLEAGRGVRGRIGHTQPRRLAARTLAARIAEELDCPLGAQVGYKVRFHDRVGDGSHIKVMTDGILLAEIQSDPELREYDTLIIDEAHERSLNIDFLLGYLRRLLPRRPDLKLVITSATIDPERFSRHFDDAPIIEVSGRTWPVEVRYRPLRGTDEEARERDRSQAILDAIDELACEGPGDVLVFLPGERAIRETAEQLRKHHPAGTEILPLYARLSAAQQSRVFREHRGRRIVLATNVAETSLTVPGIRYVVDTGLARISRYSYRSKVQRLPVEPVSRASADQRAGRCGRVAAGICIRLYSEEEYLARPAFTEAEIRRTSLAAVILQMALLGLGEIEDFPFVDAPDSRFVRDGYKLLQELDAVDGRHKLTALGRQLARLPVDPRLGRMILSASERHCLTEVMVIVAALETADPRERPLDKAAAADARHALFSDPRSDFMTFLKLWRLFHEQARQLSQNRLRKWCREHFLSWIRMREWIDVHRQLRERVASMGMECNSGEADYRSIHCALLSGLPGNVAQRIEGCEYRGARNLKFRLFPGSVLAGKPPRWLVAAELVETGRRYLRTAAAIEPQWVEAVAPHLLKRSHADPHWEKKRACVIATERVTLYGLPVVSGRKVDYSRIDPRLSRELFIRHALVRGEWRGPAAFLEHNRRLLEELDLLESKSRRRDLLVDEEVLYRFFDERIPEEVCDARRFRRWWKKTAEQQSELLKLSRALLMQHDAKQLITERFPDFMDVRGMRLALAYRFAPGDPEDGLHVRLPLAALNQVRAEDFEWLVPGLLREKFIHLIKSLPKPLRRHFVPAPDYADACLQALEERKGPLTETLAGMLQHMTGISVPGDAWRRERLPAHLEPFFELIDSDGRRLGAGRELRRLQADFGHRARDGFVRSVAAGFEREGIREWDFGTLPERVEVESDGVALGAYPALVGTGDEVALRMFDDPGQAREAHRAGVLALFRRRCGRLLRDVPRTVPEFDRQLLWFSPVADAEALRSDLEQAALQAAFPGDAGEVRDAQTFERRLEEGRRCLMERALHIGRCSFEALQAFHELGRCLRGAVTPQMLAATAEVRAQAEALIYPGFLAATPPQWLPHLGRYLRAAARRLDKLPGRLQRERESAATVRRYRSLYEEALARGGSSPELDEYRWLIEELRVSLFAQELGTAVKVSPQRLDRLWQKLRAA